MISTNRNIKNSVLIGLVLALMLPLLGGGFYLVYRRSAIRREVKTALKSSAAKADLVEFKFTQDQIKNELRWEHSKEFEYKGVMYDVIEVNNEGSLTQYWCWKDVKETALNQKLRKLTAFALGHNLPFKNQKQQLVSLIKSLFSQKLDRFNLLLFGKNLNSYSFYSENLIGELVAPPTPPPQLI